jgi:hypothetical protein
MVPLVKVGFQTPFRMQGSWSDDDVETLEVVVESSIGMDGKPNPKIKGSPQYYYIRPLTSITSQNHEKVVKIYRRIICKTHEMNQHY